VLVEQPASRARLSCVAPAATRSRLTRVPESFRPLALSLMAANNAQEKGSDDEVTQTAGESWVSLQRRMPELASRLDLTQLRALADVLAVMRRLGVFAILVLLLSATAAASGSTTRHPPAPRCPPAHTTPVAADRQAELYEAPTIPGYGYQSLFGCTYQHKRSYHLGEVPECGSPSGCGGVTRPVLSGSFVAFESFQGSTQHPATFEVEVRDLRTGRVIHRLPSGTLEKPARGHLGIGPVKAITLKPNGSVAWLAENGERSIPPHVHEPGVPYFDLLAADDSGTRLLASGANIDPSSLTIAGSTIYWTQGGEPMSAPLD